MSDENEFPLNEGDFDEKKITLQEMAKIIVPMYKAFRDEDLMPQEAAALTAAYWAHMMPQKPPQPMED